jgi:hypothetical protein
MGAPADAETGSREPDPCCTGSGPAGFDPERWHWESGPCLNRYGQISSYDICHPREPGSNGVCVVASCFEGEAVARFIAAAPRLYAALKAAVDDATGKPNVWFFDAKDALAAASGTSGSAQAAQRLDPKGAGPTAEGGDAQTPQPSTPGSNP